MSSEALSRRVAPGREELRKKREAYGVALRAWILTKHRFSTSADLAMQDRDKMVRAWLEYSAAQQEFARAKDRFYYAQRQGTEMPDSVNTLFSIPIPGSIGQRPMCAGSEE